MQRINNKIAALNWEGIAESMNGKGYALVPDLLSMEQCEELVNNYQESGRYRKTVIMER